mmetsp:Transcript_2718/g.3057  ORF Transcript_2718/g.3057 Transcript_2718/m.3057 type:complete len:182 (-) Transcript_2718:38-583(-)
MEEEFEDIKAFVLEQTDLLRSAYVIDDKYFHSGSAIPAKKLKTVRKKCNDKLSKACNSTFGPNARKKVLEVVQSFLEDPNHGQPTEAEILHDEATRLQQAYQTCHSTLEHLQELTAITRNTNLDQLTSNAVKLQDELQETNRLMKRTHEKIEQGGFRRPQSKKRKTEKTPHAVVLDYFTRD